MHYKEGRIHLMETSPKVNMGCQSPRTVVDGLRRKGNMVYINKDSKGTSYRIDHTYQRDYRRWFKGDW